jgi:hypothetical protein
MTEKPTIVVLLAPPDTDGLDTRISDAIRAELPAAVPECVFEFGTGDDDLQYAVMPVVGTVGGVDAPGTLFDRPPTETELDEARAALDEIIARVRGQKLS